MAKNIKQHIIHMTDDINRVKTLLAKLIDVNSTLLPYLNDELILFSQDLMKPLRNSGIIYGNIDAVRMSSFLPQSIMQRLNKNMKWAYSALSMLSTLARAMGYLVHISCRFPSTILF
jgi:ATP-dependent DNA helicase MPH1